MKSVLRAAGSLLAAGVLAATVAGIGAASPGSDATFSEVSTFVGNHQPPAGVFTVTGVAGCASGTFGDQLVSFNPSGARVVLLRTYACAEGGTFVARVALHLSVVDASGAQAADGTWRIVSTDGALAGFQGETPVTGVNTGCAPVGEIFAECLTGAETFTVSLH
jgi:hypothetical protein